LPSDPCSTDYEPWVAAHGDALDVTIVQVAHVDQAVLAPNQGCTSEGHPHTYLLALSSPFTGSTVNDLADGTLFVAAPAGLASASSVPTGWSVQRSFEQEPGPPPIWVQVYARAAVANDGPLEGPGQLVLYQAFGVIGEWTDTRAEKATERGAESIDVSVNGVRQQLWSYVTTGELLLGWTLDSKSLGLVGNSADMTASELVAVAESVTFESK
jgi:hypothetical protein